MTRYLFTRLVWVVPVLFGLSTLAFLMLAMVPGDAAQVLAGTDASPQDVEALRRTLGLDQPLAIQYVRFLSRLVRGDLGVSVVTRRPVLVEIVDHLPPTAELAAVSILLATAFGVSVGVASAVKQNSLWDQAIMLVALLGVSMPIFWLGLLLMKLFAVDLRLFPTTGIGGIRYLVLPAVALGASSAAITARMTRSSMLEVLRQDYVRTAHAKGLTPRRAVWNHALRNALIPTVTVIGLQVGYLLGGAVVVETVFARPGVGRMLVGSVQFRDVPMVQGTIIFLSVAFVLVNLIVDVLYALLDPRIRYA